MSSQRLLPIAFVSAIGKYCTSDPACTSTCDPQQLIFSGVLSGVYIWKQPMQELSGKSPVSQPVSDGRSQHAKDGTNKDG